MDICQKNQVEFSDRPRPTLPQCRESNTFATLKAARLEFPDERGEIRIVLSRHSRKIRRMSSFPAVKFFHYWLCFFSLFPQGRGCWRGPYRRRREGGRAAAQGRGRAVAALRAPRTGPPLAGGRRASRRDGGAFRRGLAGPAGRATPAKGRVRNSTFIRNSARE